MANPEHVALLKQGVDAWNAWRVANADVHPDLIEADLPKAELSKAYLQATYLGRAVLNDADLRGAKLGEANLLRANLNQADLTGADLTGAILLRTQLIRTQLRGANLSPTYLYEADLTEADLKEAKLRGEVPEQASEVAEAHRRFRMLGGQGPSPGSPARADRAPAPPPVALVLQQAGEVDEALRRVRMLGAKHLLADRQRTLMERPRLSVGGQRVTPVLTGEKEQVSRPLFNPFRSGRFVSHESECVKNRSRRDRRQARPPRYMSSG